MILTKQDIKKHINSSDESNPIGEIYFKQITNIYFENVREMFNKTKFSIFYEVTDKTGIKRKIVKDVSNVPEVAFLAQLRDFFLHYDNF